ncbi:MAG: response regulator [Deltaproteobacteria bacterium]|nr:response regulator [Deltaproteobacteria bacterium]MBW1816046.1 response regulator [Deltaproteobacteria bacterium]
MANILIVDDEKAIRSVIGEVLRLKGHDCTLAADAMEARELLGKDAFDLVLCDIKMPGESGLEFIRYAIEAHPNTAAIMITSMNDPAMGEDAIRIGVYDYIIKPFDLNGVVISVANALRRRQLEIDNRAYRERLEHMVAERTSALEDSLDRLQKALKGTIHAMARTVEMKDPYTAGHQQRVGDISAAIAREINLSEERVSYIHLAGLIHDVGKISIPAEILTKPGKLTEIEFELIKTHSRNGYEILKSIEFPWPIARIVLQHHERVDGSGYPSALKGEAILLEARILGVADVLETIASHRPYRPALGVDHAIEELKRYKGILYEGMVVDACLNLLKNKKIQL